MFPYNSSQSTVAQARLPARRQAAMGRIGQLVLKLVAVVALGIPVAAVTTVLSAPMWRWLSLNTSVKAYTHFGPAEWCYLLTYSILVVGGLTTVLAFQAKARRAQRNNSFKPTPLRDAD